MRSLIFCCLAVVLLGTGCVTTPTTTKTSLELQAIQSREFETTKALAFASVMSVFQDLGYVVSSADLASGFLTAKSPTMKKAIIVLFSTGMKDSKSTAFIEELPNGKARVRLTFVESNRASGMYGQSAESEKAILDPLVYQKAFEKIDEAIFVRKATK